MFEDFGSGSLVFGSQTTRGRERQRDCVAASYSSRAGSREKQQYPQKFHTGSNLNAPSWTEHKDHFICCIACSQLSAVDALPKRQQPVQIRILTETAANQFQNDRCLTTPSGQVFCAGGAGRPGW